jgi:hypothetical protein
MKTTTKKVLTADMVRRQSGIMIIEGYNEMKDGPGDNPDDDKDDDKE